MTKQSARTLVRLGEARRQTMADEDIGMLEEIPVHKFRTSGWAR